jgi:Flp pilus assembly protein TadG
VVYGVRSSREGESGAILVLLTITLVVLVGIVALSVDIGGAYAQRRKMQNASDAAALGGAQNLPDRSGATAQAESLGSGNVPKLTLDWAGCTDTAPAGFTRNPGVPSSACVTFNRSFTRVRVRIPRQTFSTLFGGILGYSSTATSTVATAQVSGVGNSGLLPFVLFAGAPNGMACLDTGGGTPASCPGGSGFFGELDYLQYGNDELGTTPSCGNGGAHARFAENTAMGADHFYSADPNTTINDDCVNAGPNMVGQGTGNSQFFDEGLVSGGPYADGEDARLQRFPTSWPGGWPNVLEHGQTVDNRPLWTFIDPALQGSTSVPASCWPSAFTAVATPAAGDLLLGACINDYGAGGYTTPVFSRNDGPTEQPLDIVDIQSSPRFSYVPQVVDSDPNKSGCSNCLRIQQFRSVFIQEVMANNPQQLDWEPGPWNTGDVGNHKAESMTAWVLPDNMLPAGLRGKPVSIGANAIVKLVG